MSISLFCSIVSIVCFLNSYLLLFLPHRSVSLTFVLLTWNSCTPFLQSGLASRPKNKFFFLFFIFFVVASPALVVGMQDNAQVEDVRGLFKSLDPAPCGAVPAYLIQCSSSSLPNPVLLFQSTSSTVSNPVYFIQCSSSSLRHPVLQFQSTSSSAPIPVCLIQYSCSSLPHPMFQIQSTSSSAPVPVYVIQCYSSSLPHPVLQFQSASSSTPVQKTLLNTSSLFLFLVHFFLSNFTFFE